MKEKSDKLNPPESQAGNVEKNNFEGYPIYPDDEDIYKNFQEEEEITLKILPKQKNQTAPMP